MNAVTKLDTTAANDDMIRVLQNSLYPGAKRESIELVLSYCRLNQLDPMLKPVYIVPTSVKVGNEWQTRDTLMPGIGLYRILAARSGEYGGKSEPEFGPNRTESIGGPGYEAQVTFPEWCRITIYRIVQGQARPFTAKELWLENYATVRKTGAVNDMWRRRAYGQLAKCAEAQALRMAFPEYSGSSPTAEEMEGKDGFAGPTLEAKAEPMVQHQPPTSPPSAEGSLQEVAREAVKRKVSVMDWLEGRRLALAAAQSREDVDQILESQEVRQARDKLTGEAHRQLETMISDALARWYHSPPDGGDEEMDDGGGEPNDIAEMTLP